MADKPRAGKRKIPWGMLYILATVIALILFGILNREFGHVFRTFARLSPGFLLISVIVTVVYFFFEGGITRLIMKSRSVKLSMATCLKISLIGLYYCYITPSATGGQPMQAAYLRREKVPVGISTAVLFMKFFCFQCAFFTCALISFLCMYPKLTAENLTLIPFIILGLIINGGSIIFFPSLFIPPVLNTLCRTAKWLIRRLRFLERFHLNDAVDKFQKDFSSYTDNFREKWGSLVIGVLLSVPQFILQMSVIYFVFLSFGYRSVSYLEVLAVQSLLQVSVSFMPMPGASGAQEIGFSAFFQSYFVRDDLYAAVMVWRFFTYYLVVIAGALLVVLDQLWYSRKKAKQEGED